jgi:hypothetical protein
VILRALAIVVALAAAAHAEPISEALRAGNSFATAGDWDQVARVVDPLLRQPLPPADRAEAHRLAGIAAFFRHRTGDAEAHFLAYLRLELDGRLDPALYPPDVIAFFTDVASRHAAELRAMRSPTSDRAWWHVLLPPLGQLQNGERTKAWVLGGTMGALLATNLTTYYFLRSWCAHTDGPGGGGLTCDQGHNHTVEARRIRPYNIASGIGFLLTYAYGVFDGVQGYRRHTRELLVQPFVDVTPENQILGVSARF